MHENLSCSDNTVSESQRGTDPFNGKGQKSEGKESHITQRQHSKGEAFCH